MTIKGFARVYFILLNIAAAFMFFDMTHTMFVGVGSSITAVMEPYGWLLPLSFGSLFILGALNEYLLGMWMDKCKELEDKQEK